MNAYESRCAVTECQVTQVLEATHIVPYSGTQSNTLSNGILLRSDIHALFDQGLIFIDTDMRVVISQNLENTIYADLKGKRLLIPKNETDRPASSFLEQHRQWADL